jgi:hypothetical protein
MLDLGSVFGSRRMWIGGAFAHVRMCRDRQHVLASVCTHVETRTADSSQRTALGMQRQLGTHMPCQASKTAGSKWADLNASTVPCIGVLVSRGKGRCSVTVKH